MKCKDTGFQTSFFFKYKSCGHIKCKIVNQSRQREKRRKIFEIISILTPCNFWSWWNKYTDVLAELFCFVNKHVELRKSYMLLTAIRLIDVYLCSFAHDARRRKKLLWKFFLGWWQHQLDASLRPVHVTQQWHLVKCADFTAQKWQ